MFKKFMTFVTVAVAALSLASCEKEGGKETPVLEFEKILYTVYDKGTVDVVIKSNIAVAEDVTIPVAFSGEAEKGVDYKIVARDDKGNEIAAEDVVTIVAGKTAGAITVKNISLSEKKQISVSFAVPEGYAAGTKKTAVVAPDSQEALVYSFQMARGYALESFVTTIKVTGTASGADFKAAEDITIPLSLTGEGASVLQFVEEGADTKSIAAPSKGPYAVLKAGQNSATVKFTVPKGYSGDKEALLTVDSDADSRFIEGGDNEFVSIAVRGLQTPDKLVGTWKFSKVWGIDEIIEFHTDGMEKDEAEAFCKELPIHNEGFSLIFTKEHDGSIKIKPEGTGDFNNFFREAKLSLSEPTNIAAHGIVIGDYTVFENNGFASEDGYVYQFNTYYELSNANRAFSSTKESLNKATIVLSLSDYGLTMEFRDYDEPPFAGFWWEEGDFDPDMFGFASLFIKEE